MDENNILNATPEQEIPATQPEAPAAQPEAPVAQPVAPAAQPVYLDDAAAGYAAQPAAPAEPVYIQDPVQPVYVQNPAQPVYIQNPVQSAIYASAPQGVSPKSRRLALIFAIVFGQLGINRFYLGNVDVARFVLTLVAYTLCLFSAFVVPAVIACGLLVYPTIGMIKDIIATAKGQMTDGQGLVVQNW